MDETQIPNDWREWWEERAALMQWDGGLPLDAAEDEALACLREYVSAFRERQRRSGAGRVQA